MMTTETLLPTFPTFSPSVAESIRHYVYCLKDPDTGTVFYVGKGTGSRIFAHLGAAISSPVASDKLDTIRAIRTKGQEPDHLILRHGLTEDAAFEVEAALIDWIGLDELSNKMSGRHSNHRGIMKVSELIALFDAPKVTIVEPAILIIVNKLYKRGKMTDETLYAATRGDWVVGERRKHARYAFAVHNGIVRQVYRICAWEAAPKAVSGRQRWRFNGEIAKELQEYVGKCVTDYITRGAQNPIKYVNC